MILHGSLALDAFELGRSDIDLLLVVEGPLGDGQFDALHAAVATLEPQAPGLVDLHVMTRELVVSPVRLPPVEAVFEIFPGRRLYVERRRAEDRDLVVELSVAREHGKALVGAAPEGLIGPVPGEWVVEVGNAVLADWEAVGDDPEHAELTVLTTCRIWRYAVERRHCSKVEAAEWALDRDPSLEVVRHALRLRRAETATPLERAAVAAMLRTVVERVAASGS